MSKLVLFNKPFNVLCQFTDKEQRTTLAHFLDQRDIYPAGRLDYDSEGLVILTNDGELQHLISNPSAKMSKTYWVQVEGIPEEQQLEQLKKGITLKDGPCLPAQVTLIDEPELWPRRPPVRHRENIPTSWLRLIIREGRNRQVRRMTATVGLPTLRLVRIKIGDWPIGNLNPGEFKEITLHAPLNDKNKSNKNRKIKRRIATKTSSRKLSPPRRS